MNKDGIIKISDFGNSSLLSRTISLKQTMTGTLLYCSPEMLKGEDYNYKTDIWSLGILLLECYLGYHPLKESLKNLSFIQMLNFVNNFKPTFN